jgi:hypothetical protein
MKNKKGFFIFFLCLICIFILSKTVLSLSVGPAKTEFNFVPGSEQEINYFVSDPAGSELELFVEGDLAQYVKLDKKTLMGGGTFNAKLKLPQTIEIPGKHRILIGVRQKIDPELVQGNIGTAIIIMVVIDIYVPYPGRYLDVKLSSYNVNVGEPVTFLLDIASQGTETVTITPVIDIYSFEKKIESLTFQARDVASQEILNLKKTLDTANYNPGNYKAIALVDYGVIAKSESDFKIGNLSISITNYTGFIPIGKIQPFYIEIESNWNDNIDGAYAEVSILNNSLILTSFKTSTTNLIPWEKKIIIGYFETSNFSKGIYDANISLFYFGKDRGVSTNKMIKVEFVEKPSTLIWFIIGGLGLAIIIVLLIIRLITKHGKRKKY